MKNGALALSSLICLLTGCATALPVAPPVDPATVQLASAAQDIRISLKQLAEAEQFDKLHRLPGAVDLTPSIPGLDQVVALPWNGPIEPIVAKIAALGGYQVEFSGKPPVLPILISLGSKPVRAAQHLRDVGIQAGDRADIVVDPVRKKVGVVYANTGL